MTKDFNLPIEYVCFEISSEFLSSQPGGCAQIFRFWIKNIYKMKNFALYFFILNTWKPDSISIIFFLRNFEMIRRHKTMRRWVLVKMANVRQRSRIAVIEVLFSFEQMNKHLSLKKKHTSVSRTRANLKGDFFNKWAYAGYSSIAGMWIRMDPLKLKDTVGSGFASNDTLDPDQFADDKPSWALIQGLKPLFGS